MQDHVRVVDSDGNVGDPLPSRPEKAPPRLRPTKALPTDRCKFEIQTNALRVYAVISDRGENPVSTKDIASRLPISESTTGLMNAFFTEAGFIVREGKGRYKPTASVIEYQRRYSFNADDAARLLAEPLKSSWYYREVARQLDLDGSEPLVIQALASAAEVGDERKAQLELVLDWLEYGGLITRADGVVKLTDETPLIEQPEVDDPPAVDPAATTQADRAKGERTTKPKDEPARPAQVVGFSFDFSLTADELRALSPDQITALFEAVGKVMAIKGATTTE